MAADFPRRALRLLETFLALLALAFLVAFFTDFLPGLFDLDRERERDRERVFEADLDRDRERDRDRDLERDFLALGADT